MTTQGIMESELLRQSTRRTEALVAHCEDLVTRLKNAEKREKRDVKFIRFLACCWAVTIFVAFWGWAR